MTTTTQEKPKASPVLAGGPAPDMFRRLAGMPVVTGERETMVVHSPLTLEPLGEIPKCTEADVVEAVRRARAAQPAWAARPIRERARVLFEFHKLLFRNEAALLDLQSVIINQKQYRIDAADISQKGKSGLGANKRTATYTGGGAAFGAVIGAIAGGGKGAAIGAGAGAGAGALTQVLTKGGAIRVPAESVLTFSLDKSLWVTAAE